jgi:nicotinic acid mononucleotide adenylyltransferase
LTENLNKWYSVPENQKLVDIVAVSMDETDVEVKKWENKILNLKGWKHFRAKGGVNSTVANDYSILSTPVMFLIESKSKTIQVLPENVLDIEKEIKK